jgi:CBS domain containing-hemolysin-like protein
MLGLIVAIALTLGISFVCSLFEAVVLSTTVAEIEALKKSRPVRGRLFETIKTELDETISAILSLNTLANGVGSMIVGLQAGHLFGASRATTGAFVIGFAIVLFTGSEVLPKNVGVAYRRALQPMIVYPLWWLRRVLRPITWLCNLFVRLFVPAPEAPRGSEEEIILLAERGAEQGTLSQSESNIITNALSLDNVRVSALMTPRTVVTALPRNATLGEIFREYPTLPFGRMPVYGKNLDDIVGLARRRDLLKAKANDQDAMLVEQLMHEVNFIPETVTIANALQVFLKTHQQLLVAVDEFGATAGVLTMEDVIEQLLGREIFEKDDLAVDMRELARSRQQRPGRTPPRPDRPAPPSG